jgi:hypothetical protein
MKYIALLLAVSLPAFASDPISEALKKGAEKERKLEEKIKKYGLKETPGFKIIGVSEPYYIIDGRQVPCDSVEMKCVNGKCTLVPKGK